MPVRRQTILACTLLILFAWLGWYLLFLFTFYNAWCFFENVETLDVDPYADPDFYRDEEDRMTIIDQGWDELWDWDSYWESWKESEIDYSGSKEIKNMFEFSCEDDFETIGRNTEDFFWYQYPIQKEYSKAYKIEAELKANLLKKKKIKLKNE